MAWYFTRNQHDMHTHSIWVDAAAFQSPSNQLCLLPTAVRNSKKNAFDIFDLFRLLLSEVWVKFRPAQSSFLLPANVEFPQFYSSFHLCFFSFVCLRLKLIGMTVTRFKCSSVIHGPCLRCMTCESRTNLTLWWPKTACSRIQKRCQRTSSHSVTHI